MEKAPTLFAFKQFSERHPAFTEGSLRWLRFNEASNGFEGVFLEVGARVLVHEEAFFRTIQSQNPASSERAA